MSRPRPSPFPFALPFPFPFQAIVTPGPKGYALKIVKVLEFPPRQQLYIEVKEKLKKKSNYTLNLRWYSKLNPEPEGFYVDQYESSNGMERFVVFVYFTLNQI